MDLSWFPEQVNFGTFSTDSSFGWPRQVTGLSHGLEGKRMNRRRKKKTPEAWDAKEEEGDGEVSRDYVDPQVDDEGREEGERVWGLQIHG